MRGRLEALAAGQWPLGELGMGRCARSPLEGLMAASCLRD